MTDYRLVAFDMDGTLLDSTRSLQPGTRKAFEAMHAAGVRIMLASGRPVPGLHLLVREHQLGTNLVFAAMNGSVVVDQATDEVIAEHPLPQDLSQDLIRRAQERNITVMVPHRNELIVEDATHPRARYEAAGNDLAIRQITSLTALDVAPTKILFVAERPELEGLNEELTRELGDRIELAYSAIHYMEATAAGVDKGSAIQDYCQANGLTLDQVIAFGDNGNDVGMLRRAGLGVAMGNGIPEAKEAADVVTTSNDDEGIARVLSRYFDFEV